MDRQSSRYLVANPEMLTVARESRGLSQRQLAEEMGLAQGTISKMEAGTLPMQGETIEALARALHYPPSFFCQRGPIMGPGIAEFYHRKRADVPQKVLDQVYALMNIRRLQVTTLLKSVEVPCKISPLDPEEYEGDIEEIARVVRAQLLIPRGPIQDLTMALEDAGVVVLPFEFGTRRIDGISQWIPNVAPMIFINPDLTMDRYRYSLAHELGHLILHSKPNPDVEAQADRFAAEFLVPAREAKADLAEVTIPKLARLKPYWRVSMQMLLKRSGDLGCITPNQSRYLWSQFSKLGYRTREPIQLDARGERATLFHEMVDMHLEDLGYSPANLRDTVKLYDDEFKVTYLRQPNQPSHLRVIQDRVPLRRNAGHVS